jgi:predicted DNA-binding ribbon-helix-helix protein
MESSVVKRSIIVAGHKTSVSLEDDFWAVLKEIASESRATLSELVGKIDAEREHGNLSSAIRLFVLRSYRRKLEEQDAIARTRDLLNTAATIGVT